jgi:hypothetical protein
MSHIPHTGAYAVTTDSRTPGTRNGEDFIFFDFPADFPVDSYEVVVPSLTSGWDRTHLYRIGPPRQRVALPQIALDPAGQVMLLPAMEGSILPRYVAKMVRGKGYLVRGSGAGQVYQMAIVGGY